jgi:hypothetical protein
MHTGYAQIQIANYSALNCLYRTTRGQSRCFVTALARRCEQANKRPRKKNYIAYIANSLDRTIVCCSARN